ncbi:hypothetical protein [Clostridium botulinum]|uniref:hypothetical protein n=1 Tax=Clostridium botulinum TaxID=1491 RepID=UPI000774918C|nr:hypothetical protein [Clostridium botulinum]MBY6952213.1 hypothetical protein [Clostridium botulinum]
MFEECKATTRNRPQAPGKQPKKMENIITIKLNLDTTEFENKLDRIEKKLTRIKDLKDVLRFDKSLNEVKNITINNNVDIKKLEKILKEMNIEKE